MKLGQKAKPMVLLLILVSVLGAFGVVLQALGFHAGGRWLSGAILLALLGLLALHSVWQLGRLRAAGFFVLAAGVGLVLEIWGLADGTFFGGDYIYNSTGLKFWGVPYIIPLYWAVFIYTAYSMTNAFWTWCGRHKPSGKTDGLVALVPLVIVDGLLTVALDLILDPIKVREGDWTWLDQGAYFGIPVGNFVGWFLVTAIVTGLFRLYEYWRPIKPATDSCPLLIPVIGYGTLGAALGVSAAVYGMYAVAALSILLMVLPAAANLALYRRWAG
jgi:putative membrane protein